MATVTRSLVLVVCCGIAAVWTASNVKASPPVEGGQPAIGEREFIPRAGYLRTVRMLQVRRQLMAAGAAAAPLNTRPISGVRMLPVILVDFSNVPGPLPAADYQELMFGFGPDPNNLAAMRPTMRQYYQDVSHGKFDVQGQVFDWCHLPKSDTYYENGRNGDGRPFGELLKLGLEQADAQTDFGQFDNDGADGIANSGDDDGFVDTVLFIHPEAGAEVSGLFPSTRRNIWSHSWHYSEPSYGHNDEPFETQDVQRQGDGTPMLKPDGTPAHILVEDYTIQPGLERPNDPGNPTNISTIGVICHEYGHALGLPDLYDRTPDDPDSEGVGNWCLMAGGSYGADGDHSELPAHMSAWCKQYLGWANVVPIMASTTLVLEPAEASGKVFRFDVPGSSNREYFLIEYRKNDWASPGHVNWDGSVGQSGLAIWHIDESVGGGGAEWPFADHDQGQNDSPSKPGSSKHALVALEQADQQLHLENAANRGDDSDLWRTGDSFQNSANGGSQSYAGQATGFGITAVDLVADSAVVTIGTSDASPPIAASSPQNAPDDDADRLTVRRARSPSAERSAARLRADLIETDDRKLKDYQLVQAVQKELKAGPGQPIPAETKKQLSTIPETTLRSVVMPAHRTQILNIVAKERQSQISAASAGQNRAEKAVVAALKNADYSQPVDVQVSASRDFVARITNLDLPATQPTLAADAKAKLEGPLEPLFDQVALDVAKQQPSEQAVVFQQSVEKDGEKLPVFNSSVVFHYGKEGRRLQAVSASNIVKPEDLQLTGKSTITKADATQVLGDYLGADVSEQTKEDCRKGVYLINGEPDKARVAYRAYLPVGENQKPIQVYIDAETKQVLGVE